MVLVKAHSSGQSRGDVWCLPTKHHGILRFCRLPPCPEPPFSRDAAKGMKPNHLMGTAQSQPCHCHLPCLAACPAVVPGVWPEGPRLVASQVPWCLWGHTHSQASPSGQKDSRIQTISSGSKKHEVKSMK